MQALWGGRFAIWCPYHAPTIAYKLRAKTKCLHQKHPIQVSARTTAITCESIVCIIVYLCLVAWYRGFLSFPLFFHIFSWQPIQCPSVPFQDLYACR